MKKTLCMTLALMMLLSVTACSAVTTSPAPPPSQPVDANAPTVEAPTVEAPTVDAPTITLELPSDPASTFDLTLDDYQPLKNSYKFYFNYKNIHVWYDAIMYGIQAAVDQYADRGITVEYEWIGSADPDCADQVTRIEEAVGRGFDVIGVEPANLDLVAPSITNMVASGVKVMCFGASDLFGYEESSGRACYVGVVDPAVDAIPIVEDFCKNIDYKGKVALLGGTIGAPGHEAINNVFHEVVAQYPDIEVVDVQYDNDELEKAITFTENFLQKTPDLAGIFCNNMTNPIGAAQAVSAAGKSGEIYIAGYDHDIQALEYLRDGTIGSLAICDCYGIGFNTLMNCVKLADGLEPGENFYSGIYYPTVIVYKDGAQTYIDTLYPDYKG